ncbi:hypothetical protein GCM10010211_40590 [Streptomyces albospinus]|uniref:Transmembrane protein n=1 Tax=Streptomyces albospinus TaxID=285515 RepID=A0ABQ2V6D9_9ACTN|nr:hypothetical protein [Streptomyces albospinus]GGU70776.1 hypothetical protein GCM10010211_40590 [Streptomyces albospinus]
MTSYDARTALDAIHHHQEQTRDAYVRHGAKLPYLLVTALAVFGFSAAFDLPNPWRTLTLLAGGGLMTGMLFVHQRRAPVRRKPSSAEWALSLWVGGVVTVILVAAVIGARLLGLPEPSMVAGAVAAVATVVAGYATRPTIKAITRRDGHG